MTAQHPSCQSHCCQNQHKEDEMREVLTRGIHTEHQVVFELQRKSSEYIGINKEIINKHS